MLISGYAPHAQSFWPLRMDSTDESKIENIMSELIGELSPMMETFPMGVQLRQIWHEEAE